MSVEKEIAAAKRQRNWGFIIAAVSCVFIFASLVLSLYDASQSEGWGPIGRLTSYIYAQTQYPVLSTIWVIAARPDLVDMFQLRNLWFAGEVLAFLVGAVMVGAGDKTLRDIFTAEYEATQQRRKEEFQKKQQEKLKEKEREKDKDLS